MAQTAKPRCTRQVNQVPSMGKNTPDESREPATTAEESLKLSSLTISSMSMGASECGHGVIPTGHPNHVQDDDVVEDLEDAIILEARWEKLSRATPTRVLLPQGNRSQASTTTS